jgi:hypothetical protein
MFAYLILFSLMGVLTFTIVRLVRGQSSVSGYMKNAPRWVVASVAYFIGLVTGIIFAHWWFPTIGV